MPLSTGQLLNERYRIEQQIGQGGFGAVYRAYDVTLQQPCAIKENLNTGAEAQRQFEREALILARLRHPNLPHRNLVSPSSHQLPSSLYGDPGSSYRHTNTLGNPYPGVSF